MAKRFTESGKFRDAWYRNLSPKGKCIWEFMISECNAAGILDIDLKSITFHIGVPISMKDIKAFDDRLVWIREDKVFIPKFIKFQYPGGLNPDNRAHKNILPMLEEYVKFDEKEGAWKPLARPLQGPKEKETEQVQVTETVQETETTTSAKDNNAEQSGTAQADGVGQHRDNAGQGPQTPGPAPKDAGTFRAPLADDAPINQRFAAWFIKTVLPDTYATCDKKDTGDWFNAHGTTLSWVIKKADGDFEFLKDITAVSMKDMDESFKDKSVPVPTSLEVIKRHWHKYLPLANKMKQNREANARARQAHEYEVRRKQQEEEAAFANRVANTTVTPEERDRVAAWAEDKKYQVNNSNFMELYFYLKDTDQL